MNVGYFDVKRTDRPVSRAAGCLDVGGFEDAFTADAVWLRVYENKGLPDPDRYAEVGVVFATAHRRAGQRFALVGLNEVNSPFERTGLDPAGYRAWFARWRARVKTLDPTLECWWAGMSPGVPGALAWYTGCEAADGVILHAYGLSVDEMMALPRLVRRAHPDVRWMVGEANHGVGAGRVCDRNVWATECLAPALTEAHGLGCEAFLYFVYDGWTQDDPAVGQATPPIARGTQIEGVLRDWRPAQEAPVADHYPAAAQRPISVNYTPGRAGRVVRLLVHHIADGLGDPFTWFNTDRGENGSSAHFWVSKLGKVVQYRPLSDTCWANGPVCQPDLTNPVVQAVTAAGSVNAQTVAIEHEGASGDTMPFAQWTASRTLTHWLGDVYGLPLDRVHVVGHYQIDKCTRPRCPGPTHPWAALLGGPPVADTADQLRDQTFALASQLQALDPKWKAAGWPSLAAGIGSNAEAIKSLVRASKGEK